MVIPVGVPLFSSFKLTNRIVKPLEGISHAQVVCLVFELGTSFRSFDDFSLGFDRNHKKRRKDSKLNKVIKGELYVTFLLRDIFGFAQWMEKATDGLGYVLTLTRNQDNAVSKRNGGVLQMVKL